MVQKFLKKQGSFFFTAFVLLWNINLQAEEPTTNDSDYYSTELFSEDDFSNFEKDIYFPQNENNFNVEKNYSEALEISEIGYPSTNLEAKKRLIQNLRVHFDHIPSLILMANLILNDVENKVSPWEDLQKALILANRVLDKEPNNPKIYILISRIFLILGNEEISNATLKKIQDVYPNETYFKTMEIFKKYSGNPEKIVENYFDLVQAEGFSKELIQQLLILIDYLQNPELKMKYLILIPEKQQDKFVWDKIARVFMEQKKYKESQKSFQKSIDLGDQVDSKLGLAVLSYQHFNKAEVSKKLLLEVLQYFEEKKFFPIHFYSLVYGHLSLVYSKLHDKENFKKSIERLAYYESISHEELEPTVLLEYKNEKKENQLVYFYQKCLEYDPFFAEGYVKLFELYSLNHQYDLAYEKISQGILLDPKNFELYTKRAYFSYEQEEYQSSLKDFQKALELKPENAEIIYNIACVLNLLGKKEESRQQLKLALQIDESLKERMELDEDLK